MSRVQALTRIDQNSPQFKALREQALKLGSETQFTAGDAASGGRHFLQWLASHHRPFRLRFPVC